MSKIALDPMFSLKNHYTDKIICKMIWFVLQTYLYLHREQIKKI